VGRLESVCGESTRIEAGEVLRRLDGGTKRSPAAKELDYDFGSFVRGDDRRDCSLIYAPVVEAVGKRDHVGCKPITSDV
jgi:hypothetical protein